MPYGRDRGVGTCTSRTCPVETVSRAIAGVPHHAGRIDDQVVRSGSRLKLEAAELAGRDIQHADVVGSLAHEPHPAVPVRERIARARRGAPRDVPLIDGELLLGQGWRGREQRRQRARDEASHGETSECICRINLRGRAVRRCPGPQAAAPPPSRRHRKYTGTPRATMIRPGHEYSGFWNSRFTQKIPVAST